MAINPLFKLAFATICSLLVAAVAVAAPSGRMDKLGILQSQAEILDRAINRSSVTDTLSVERRDALSLRLQSAVQELREGDLLTAEGIMDGVARELYTMEGDGRAGSNSMPTKQLNDVFDSVFPEALRIAWEKSENVEMLLDVAQLMAASRFALEHGDEQVADTLARQAYFDLMTEVSELRNGEMLLVEIPDPGTAEGWSDAIRRYAEWKNVTLYLKESAEDYGRLDEALAAAERHFETANQLAAENNWLQAVTAIDGAYGVFESAWREIGLDV